MKILSRRELQKWRLGAFPVLDSVFTGRKPPFEFSVRRILRIIEAYFSVDFSSRSGAQQ
jgi:hypothetical protein